MGGGEKWGKKMRGRHEDDHEDHNKLDKDMAYSTLDNEYIAMNTLLMEKMYCISIRNMMVGHILLAEEQSIYVLDVLILGRTSLSRDGRISGSVNGLRKLQAQGQQK